MKIDEIKLLVNQLISLLEKSEESIYAGVEPSEIIMNLQSCILDDKISQEKLTCILLPTASLQETAIDNGWGDKYSDITKEIDNHIDEYLKDKSIAVDLTSSMNTLKEKLLATPNESNITS